MPSGVWFKGARSIQASQIKLECPFQKPPIVLFALANLACQFQGPYVQGWMDNTSLSSSPESGCSWDMGSEGPTEPDPEVEENVMLQRQKLWGTESHMRMMVDLTAIEKAE